LAQKIAAAKKEAAKARAGKNSFPPNPLPFCPPERSVLVLPPAGRQSVGILFKMSSDFFQQTPPLNFISTNRSQSHTMRGKIALLKSLLE